MTTVQRSISNGIIAAAAIAVASLASPVSAEPSQWRSSQTLQKSELNYIEHRLKETDAIGFFRKLSLKSEFDSIKDALDEGVNSRQMADLQDRFETLITETAEAIGDGDPTLSSELLALRQRMWVTLVASAFEN